LFHNATFFGSCIIHIIHTGCANIKKKFRRQRVKYLVYEFWHHWIERFSSGYIVVWTGNCYILVTFRLDTILNLRHDWRPLSGPTRKLGVILKDFTNGAQLLHRCRWRLYTKAVCNFTTVKGRHLSFSFCFWSPVGGPLFGQSARLGHIVPNVTSNYLHISICLIDSSYLLWQFAWHVAYRSCLRIPPDWPHAWVSKLFNDYDYH
jgi:hypothetical protein